MSEPTDEVLALRAQLGDREALTELIERWQGPVWRFLHHSTLDRRVADDLAQDVWLAVLRGLGRLRQADRFRTWLFTIARRTATDRLRRRYRRPPLEPLADEIVDPAASDVCDRVVNRDLLARRVAALDDRERLAVSLHYFQSESADARDVVVGSETGFVWQVSGDWVTLQHLTLQQNARFSEYARVLEISGDVNHINVLHNRLIGTTEQTNIHDRFAVLFNWKTSNYAADDVLVEGNEILNGSVGIYWGGSSLFEGSGLQIRNNSVRNWGMRGVQVLTEPGVEIIGNEITTTSTYSTFPYALLLESSNGPVRIEKNRISTTHYIGLGIREAIATASEPAVIANNFVLVGSPASTGLDLYESDYQHALHNTVAVSGNFGSDVAMKVYYGNHNVLLNNVFTNDAGGSAIKITFPDVNVDESDFNLLHAASGFVGITRTFDQHASLADWQLATGLDLNSLEDEPVFVAAGDLHLAPASPGIDAAQPGVVPDDIDYALRPDAADIGADEQGYSACAFLAAVTKADCPLDNGAIDLTAIVGDPPFLFSWNDGADTEDRFDLAPGTYSVEVRNDFGCDWSETFLVECAPPDPPLELVVETTLDPACFGLCNGVVEVSARGGKPPYSFFVRTPQTGWQVSSGYEEELCAESYAFRVEDAAGTREHQLVSLSEPLALRGRGHLRLRTAAKVAPLTLFLRRCVGARR